MKQLKLTKLDGSALIFFLNAQSVVEVEEAWLSQKWHGARSNVRVQGSKWHEVQETIEDIARQLA